MLVKIASKEWLRNVAGIVPYVIDPMLEHAGKTIEVTEGPDLIYSEKDMELINELGISLPIHENIMYLDDEYTWSILMLAETEEYNKSFGFNVENILNFIEGGI